MAREVFQVSSAGKNAMFCLAIIIQDLLIFWVLRYKLLNKKLINPELADSLDWQTAWVKNEQSRYNYFFAKVKLCYLALYLK